MTRRRGRGRLSAIDLLPEECSPIITWAAAELGENNRTQLDIYAEFQQRLIALQGETGIGFDIPSFKSFNGYSIRLAQISRRLKFAREMAATLSDRFDVEGSDDLTRIGADSIKSLVLEILMNAGDGGISPKGAMELASALRAANAAEAVSSARRQKIEAEFENKVEDAVDKVAKAKGMSAETAEDIKSQILGIKKDAA